MNQVNSRTQEIKAKIQAVDVLFRKASKKIDNSILRKKMDDILTLNSCFLKDLDDKITIPELEETKREVETRKHQNRMDGLNEKELLWMCLNNEEELVKLYQKAISYYQLNKPEDRLFKKQLYTSLSHFNQMKMIRESLHYQN